VCCQRLTTKNLKSNSVNQVVVRSLRLTTHALVLVPRVTFDFVFNWMVTSSYLRMVPQRLSRRMPNVHIGSSTFDSVSYFAFFNNPLEKH
jgi:hypothetical protein